MQKYNSIYVISNSSQIEENIAESEGQQANKAPHRMLINPQWVTSFPVMKSLCGRLLRPASSTPSATAGLRTVVLGVSTKK